MVVAKTIRTSSVFVWLEFSLLFLDCAIIVDEDEGAVILRIGVSLGTFVAGA